MSSIRLFLGTLLAVFLLPGAAFALPWSWDMYDQPSHKAQEEPAPPQPEGTVSINGRPFDVKKERLDAVRLKNPVKPTLVSIERGRKMYRTYCAVCHGKSGRGDGPVGKKYIPPTDLTSNYVQAKPDGDIYFTITNGGLAVMPIYADSIPVMDRWNIINYIKHGLVQEQAVGGR